MSIYLISIFCRMVIGWVFLLSSLGKVGNIHSFIQAIANFRLLPAQLNSFAAFAFLGCEIALVYAMIFAGPFLISGFLLAGILLSVFLVALISVLVRNISIACDCFGSSDTPVSPLDLVRNVIFILCSLAGIYCSIALPIGPDVSLGIWGTASIILLTLIFVMVVTRLSEIWNTIHALGTVPNRKDA